MILPMNDQQLTEQRIAIGALLKSERLRLNLTQQNVADNTGGELSTRTIMRGEKGYPLGVNQLIKWCAALGINLSEIIALGIEPCHHFTQG